MKKRWVGPISETAFKNYVQRVPPPQKSQMNALYNSLVSDGIAQQGERFLRGATKDVPTARRLIRSAADRSIASHGLFDDRTKKLLNITETKENEDAFLRDVFGDDPVDADRVEQYEIEQKLNRQELNEEQEQDQLNRMKEAAFGSANDGFGASLIRSANESANRNMQLDYINDVTKKASPSRDEDADNRSVAEAYLNRELKKNPTVYKDPLLLNQLLKNKNVPVSIREHAVELCNSRMREDASSSFINEIATSRNAFYRPDFYTSDVSKLGYEKTNGYLGKLQQQLHTESSNQLSDYIKRLNAERKRKLPAVGNDPIKLMRLNNEYAAMVEKAKDHYDSELQAKYQQHLPFNGRDAQALNETLLAHGVHEKSPVAAAKFLGAYHDRLLRQKLLENPKLDRELFDDLFQKTATEMVHTVNGKPTRLGVELSVGLRRSMMARLGNTANRWDSAFGLSSSGSKAAQEYDDAAGMEGSVELLNGVQKVGMGAYEKVRYNGEKVLGSILTMMKSDEVNDEELAAIKEKLHRKIRLTFDERQLLDAISYKDMMKSLSGRTDPYFQGGEAVTDMIPYTLQFMAGNKAMNLTGFSSKLNPVFRAAEGGQKIPALARAGNAVRNALEMGKQSAAISAMFPSMGRMNANRRLYADASTMNNDGSFEHAVEKGSEASAAVKGHAEAFIDNYTENLGIGIDRGMIYLGKGAGAVGKAIGLSRLASRADRLVNKIPGVKGVAGRFVLGSAYMDENAAKGVREIMKNAKINGVLGEYLEEEASRNISNVALGDNNGKLQFADPDFLKTTGSSVAAYSLLSGGLFTGINALASKKAVYVPKLSDRGIPTGELEKVRVSRRAMEVMNELGEKGELTPERVGSLASRYSKKEGAVIQRYGNELIEQLAEKQELEEKKEDLIKQGVKEQEMEGVTSVTQANEIIANRDLIDAGYAEVNNRGLVKMDLDRLQKDIDLTKSELDRSESEPIDGGHKEDLTVKLNKLTSLQKEVIDRVNRKIGELLPVGDNVSIDQLLSTYNGLEQEVAALSQSHATVKKGKELVEKKAALAMLHEKFMQVFNAENPDELIAEYEQELDTARAEKRDAETVGQLERNLDVLSMLAEQHRMNREAVETSEERDEAIAKLDREEAEMAEALPVPAVAQQEEPVAQQEPAVPEAPVSDSTDKKQENADSSAIIEGPMMLHSLVSRNKDGKLTGNRKAIVQTLKEALNLPSEASVKVSFAKGTVSASVDYKGRKRQYKLVRAVSGGLVEVDRTSLAVTIANDLLAIDREQELSDRVKEQQPKAEKVLDSNDSTIVAATITEEELRRVLNENLDDSAAMRLGAIVTSSARRSNRTVGEQVLAILAAIHNGKSPIDEALVEPFLSVIPKLAEGVMNRSKPIYLDVNSANNINNRNDMEHPDGTLSDGDGKVRTSDTYRIIDEKAIVDKIVSVELLKTSNEIENRGMELIQKNLKKELDFRMAQLKSSREEILSIADNVPVEQMDAAIGDAEQYAQFLLGHSGVSEEFKKSNGIYELIRGRSLNGLPSYAQLETAATFVQMGLMTYAEMVKARKASKDANEAIHRAVLRLYVTTVGTKDAEKNDVEQAKKYLKLVNKQRTSARAIDQLVDRARTINRMVQAYNVRFALKMSGGESETAPSVEAIAKETIGRIEKKANEYIEFLNLRELNSDKKQPGRINLNEAEYTVKAVAQYAIRLNQELLDDDAEVNQEINELAGRVCSAISAVNKLIQEKNESRKRVNPMVGGLSIDSPALQGSTVSECLDAIIAGNGENASSARYVKLRLEKNPKLVLLSSERFDERLNRDGVNHNAVALYDRERNEVVLNEQTGNHEHALLHELLHALTVQGLSENAAIRAELNDTVQRLRSALSVKGLGDHYGLSSVEEFLAEYHSNGAFARMVDQAGQPDTLIGRLVAAVRRLLRRLTGLPEHPTVHDRVLFLTDELLDRSELLEPLVAHETDEAKNMIYALEASGTPAKRNARAAFIQLMLLTDAADKESLADLSFAKVEERIKRVLNDNPSLAIEAFKKAGYGYEGSVVDAADELLQQVSEDSLLRYQTVSFRIRRYNENKTAERKAYQAAENDAAASSEERFAAQQKVFNPIVKELAKLTGETRDALEVKLMNRLKQEDALAATFNESEYQLWLDQLEGAGLFDRALGAVLSKGWGHASFVSAVVFYRSARLERHLKIMFSPDGEATVSTINSKAQLKDLNSTFFKYLDKFTAKHTIFEFGRENRRPTEQERKAVKKQHQYRGVAEIADYVSSIRASMSDDYSKGRTTRMEEYNRELSVLQNLTGIGKEKWDVLLSSDGYDSGKVFNLGNGIFERVTFSSYKDYCQRFDLLNDLFSDKQPHTKEEILEVTGIDFTKLTPEAPVVLNDRNSYFFSERYGYVKDQYPCSVMTNSIFSRITRSTGASQKEKDAHVKDTLTALIQLFSGTENSKRGSVRSNIDQLASALEHDDTLTMSGFGVDGNRISGMVMNSSLHHIAENISSLNVENNLTRFYAERGGKAAPVVLNGMVDLSDRDNPVAYDKLNNKDYWRAQLLLFIQKENQYYASLGVFSDKGRGLFIEAPKYSLTWNEDGSFDEHDELTELFPDFDDSLAYFLGHYAFGILPKTMGLTSDEERRICTEFFASFVRNIRDINEVFQGEGYKSLTDMVKRGAPVISPGYNPITSVEGGLNESYTHMVISDIINTDAFGNEYELANGIQFATQSWFDRFAKSVGDVYSGEELYGRMRSTKALTTGINQENGKRFLTKTNIICIDDVADLLGGRWATLRDFMVEHSIDTVSSPSGTKKNSHSVKGMEAFQKNVGTADEPKYDGAFNLFELDSKSYTPKDIAQFVQLYRTNDLYVQQDLRHEAKSEWSKHSKQHRMNFISMSGHAEKFERLVNEQANKRIALFNAMYNGAQTEEDKKLVLANTIIDRSNMLSKPITSLDDVADAISGKKYRIDEEDEAQLLAIMNPDAKLDFPSIAKWVRTKLSSALRKSAIEIKVNRTSTQELPDFNQEHVGYKVIDNSNFELKPILESMGLKLTMSPKVRLAEASTSDGSGAMRHARLFDASVNPKEAVMRAIRYAYRFQDMFSLNSDGTVPKLPVFDGTISPLFNLHELRLEQLNGRLYVVVPGEPFITNRVPGSSLVSHSVVRLRTSLGSDVNYTILNVDAQLASGSDFDGDSRYNQLLFHDKNQQVQFNDSINGINNQMILVAKDAYHNVANYDRITRPLDVDYANASVRAIRAKRLLNAQEQDRYGLKNSYDMLDPIGYEDARIKNAAGVTMKAIMANLNSAFSYLKASKVKQSKRAAKKLGGRTIWKVYSSGLYEKTYGSQQPNHPYFSFGDIVEDRFDIVKKVVENELNKAFDNAKDPKIEDQGITEVTANLFVFMLSTSRLVKAQEQRLYQQIEKAKTWQEGKALLDRFFSEVTLEADAIFNYLNTPIVQEYITLSRSSTVGNYLSHDKIEELMSNKYAEVPGGMSELNMLMDLLNFSQDLSVVQRAVNASDTNIGQVSDFVDYAKAIAKVVGNSLSYFVFDKSYGWDNPQSWVAESLNNIKLHAYVLYDSSIEYSMAFVNAMNVAERIVSDNGKNKVTKAQKSAISNAITQALTCSVVYKNVTLPSLEKALIEAMGDDVLKQSNAFTKLLMLSGVPGSYHISSTVNALGDKPNEDEVAAAKAAFRKMTRSKVLTVNGHRHDLGEMIYLYQLMRYGNSSVKGGFLDLIDDDTISSYSSKFVKMVNETLSVEGASILNAAVAYASYVAFKKGRVAKSTWAKLLSNVGKNNVVQDEFNLNVWLGSEVQEFVKTKSFARNDDSASSIDQIPVSLLNKLSRMNLARMSDNELTKVLEDMHLEMVNSEINRMLENDGGSDPVSRAQLALRIIENAKKKPYVTEVMNWRMLASDTIFNEDTSEKEAILMEMKTSSTGRVPLAYLLGDNLLDGGENSGSINRVFKISGLSDSYFAVTNVHQINVGDVFNDDFIRRWSESEGWNKQHFMSMYANAVIGRIPVFQTSFKSITKEEFDKAIGQNNGYYAEEGIAIPLSVAEGTPVTNGLQRAKGKLIYATPTTGKTHMADRYRFTTKPSGSDIEATRIVDMDDIIRSFLTHDKKIDVSRMSNKQVGLELYKLLNGKTMKERQAIIRPLIVRVNAFKKAGDIVLTGNSFFLEDRPYSDFGGKLRKWVNEWYTSTDVSGIAKVFSERGDTGTVASARKLVEREQQAVGDMAVQLYRGEFIENRLLRREAPELMDKLSQAVGESAESLITLQELTDRVDRLVESGLSEDDAVLAIARNLKCK